MTGAKWWWLLTLFSSQSSLDARKLQKVGILPAARCNVHLDAPSYRCSLQLGATFTPVFSSARCPDQLGDTFILVLLHPDAPFSLVPRPARFNVHHGASFSSVRRSPGCPFSSVLPSVRCPVQIGAPFSCMPCSAAQFSHHYSRSFGSLTWHSNPRCNLLCQECIYQFRYIIRINRDHFPT